jgi:hypothetical protein
MNNQTLSRVTLQTLENYRTAASQAVVAYRLGSHRLVGAVNGALENAVYPRTAKLAPRATDRMNDVRGNVSDIVVKGIDQVAERTGKAIDIGADTAVAQVTKVADFAAGIDNAMVSGSLQTAARLTMPGAKVALAVSGKVVDGAQALATAVAGKPVKAAARKAGARVQRAAKPVVRKAKAAKADVSPTLKSATRRAGKAVTKTVKAVEAEVAKAPRRVRAARKAVADVVAGCSRSTPAKKPDARRAFSFAARVQAIQRGQVGGYRPATAAP